jgi:myo-inositol-1(or 4)-monophosphatase
VTNYLAASVERVRMLGSAAIDLAWVADGRLDASIMLSNKPWDRLPASSSHARPAQRSSTSRALDTTFTRRRRSQRRRRWSRS